MPNVLIRPLTIEDASVSFKWRNDPDIWKYTGNRPDKVITEEIERTWLAKKLTETNSVRYAIIADNQYIGNIQITDIIEEERGQYHIFIGEKKFWGKGIARQATAQIIRIAKEKLMLKELYLIVKPENSIAIKLYERSGFIRVNQQIRMSLKLSNFNPPTVSVFVITYNHENYIAQALDGILMQKANFDFEIVIGEDCSTDNTRKIVLEYADKFPAKFKLLLHEHNIGAAANQVMVFQACTGKYIALCEGDDYWTDPYKLQKQVDFLEANEDFAICFHNMKIIYDDGRVTHLSNLPDQKEVTTIEDLAHGNYIYTASCLYRNGLFKEFPSWFKDAPVGDYILHMLNAQYGRIKFLPDIMGVYRIHKGGIWESKDYIFRIIKWVELLELMRNHFNQEIIDIFIQTQSNYYSELIKYFHNDSEKCKYYSKLKIDCNPFLISELIKQIEQLRHENKTVLNSKTYKLGAFVLKPYSFLKRIINA